MKILFDEQIFYMQYFGGISRYFAEIIMGINKEAGIKTVPRRFFSNNIHLMEKGLASYRMLKSVSFVHKGRVRNHIYKLQVEEEYKALKNGNYEVFHPTYYNAAFLRYLMPGKPFVVTVHDMIHELYLDKSSESIHFETENKRKLLPLANHIIAVSQNTKNDILKFFPEIKPSKISIAYHGSSLSMNNTLYNYNLSLPVKYILYVGKREAYKNFLWFIKSAAKIVRDKNIFIVCAGGGNLTECEMSVIDKERISNKVLHIDIKGDDDLATMYKKAVCLIYPSVYEGFGMPILEAFACGCPVILSNTSSFLEVAGEAGLYFELNNPQSMIDAITKLIESNELSNIMKNEGFNRLQLFSWKDSVKEHCRVYKSLLS